MRRMGNFIARAAIITLAQFRPRVVIGLPSCHEIAQRLIWRLGQCDNQFDIEIARRFAAARCTLGGNSLAFETQDGALPVATLTRNR